MSSRGDHFDKKGALGHLADARQKGALAIAEFHGLELSGSFFSFFDSVRDLTILSTACLLVLSWEYALCITIPFCLWKMLRSGLWGWSRLERLHRLIEEERFEIEHNREQEKLELIEIYKAKGFKPPLLDQVVSTLMSDDNRLLQVMLEEELGLRTEIVDHPLRQALYALLGAVVGSSLLFASYFVLPFLIWPAAFVLFLVTSLALCKKLHISPLTMTIWSLASGAFALLVAEFLKKWLLYSLIPS